jgi:hypothetical protein
VEKFACAHFAVATSSQDEELSHCRWNFSGDRIIGLLTRYVPDSEQLEFEKKFDRDAVLVKTCRPDLFREPVHRGRPSGQPQSTIAA